MSEFRVNVSASQVVNVPFGAKQILVNNILPRWLYIRLGGSDIPTQNNCDLAVPPMSTHLVPIPASRTFGVGLGSSIITLGRQVPTGQNAIVTFYDTPLPSGLGSINLNPSTIGTSQAYPITASTSLLPSFPATQMYVSNYLSKWIYYATDINAIVASAPELVLNPGFETLGANPPTFANWNQGGTPSTSSPGHSGTYSCLLYSVGGLSPLIYQTFPVVPSTVCRYSFWYKDDGFGFQRRIYDATNSVDIVPLFAPPVSADWTQYTLDFLVPANCTSVALFFYSPPQNGISTWLDDVSVRQITPTDTNNQGGIAPLSEKSISLAPCQRIEIGIGAQTVTATTSVPTSASTITLYEYPIPITLGTAPLSPGGFRYASTIRGQSIINYLTPATKVDLSNFTKARWQVVPNMAAGGTRYLIVAIRDLRAGIVGLPDLGDVPPVRDYPVAVEFNAGVPIEIDYTTSDTGDFTVSAETLEAW